MDHQIAYLLLGEGGRTAAETIGSFFCNAFVRLHKIPKHISLGRRDDTGVYVGPRAEVVENSGRDGGIDEIESFLPL